MLKALLLLIPLACVILVQGQHQQQQQYTTPVPILKQINRQNEDGSYSYGYEGADKSFKIETKYPNGEVYGKYGYVDDTGNVREVEYGASRRGFEPQGSDINVPPPTINNNQNNALGPNEEDDGQYREDPSVYYKDAKYNVRPAVKASHHRLTNSPVPQQQNYQQQSYQQNYIPQEPRYQQQQQQYQQQPQQYQQQPQQYQQQPQQTFQNRNQYQPQPQYQQNYYQPQQQQQFNNYQRQQQQPDLFRGHPAQNFDINTGSYSLTYTG